MGFFFKKSGIKIPKKSYGIEKSREIPKKITTNLEIILRSFSTRGILLAIYKIWNKYLIEKIIKDFWNLMKMFSRRSNGREVGGGAAVQNSLGHLDPRHSHEWNSHTTLTPYWYFRHKGMVIKYTFKYSYTLFKYSRRIFSWDGN